MEGRQCLADCGVREVVALSADGVQQKTLIEWPDQVGDDVKKIAARIRAEVERESSVAAA